MHDIRLIRDNPHAFDAGLARRGLAPLSAEILAADAELRALQTDIQAALARRNEASKLIGQAMAAGDKDKAEALKAEVAALKAALPAREEAERAQLAALHDRLAALPNLPADDVPDGEDEAGNVELSRWGTPRSFDFTPLEHADFAPALGLDFETAAKMSGARFAFLKGPMARLERALGQFMLDRQTIEAGYTECATPLLVRDDAAFGTTQLPKFREDLFQTTDGLWLISTSEMSLTNAVREQILAEADLPIRMTALTPCFRSEAGSAGRDTRGYIRQHQFWKVELVSITRPEDSDAELERKTRAAESILEALELPYRKMLLCAGDMGFAARKTYDLEVWLPGQNAYREISSCSNCGDFQARRMNARFRREGGKGNEFVHTLNGSGLAVGRTLVAILENYQQADGSVDIPAALLPYMGGITRLTPLG
ncbi:serine--tRNA ligase [Sphingopyxis alaskensis]|jgi:seryl-tRNA synthetase|uniref:Serine--tRNA ligase n=1 Tax=Sphingopyxis alaskensis (strain DSM 13593 / LMG 18877 / RB2256) TaxID=317655 RepID=SYS_SPHAL|nr:serine--tRNA ligase [Sphingopyxis alaskensis]Q1GV79.1 RecName: Full=Serine--tRNA ligase; AltName: Full=Seryl-tRNA synthetase; Short=SerRS; AltName: Full=Seryl-tRNA(Ser/Sec) synthetase [Sphingopyxis alaskensis RB2256]ABF52443.1 seryl-tRNA synthetase [Sphingopyxis alaskensis RB2256]MCM3420884.1 serine--tRNA ligase [Sphingopyxis alaskensis]